MAHSEVLKAARHSQQTFGRTLRRVNGIGHAQHALGGLPDTLGIRAIVDEDLVNAMESPETRNMFFQRILEGSSLLLYIRYRTRAVCPM